MTTVLSSRRTTTGHARTEDAAIAVTVEVRAGVPGDATQSSTTIATPIEVRAATASLALRSVDREPGHHRLLVVDELLARDVHDHLVDGSAGELEGRSV